jgi:predicted ATPase
MKLKKMTLENFRSFKGKHEIEFSPITLLFGVNSAGKSSVIKAIKKHESLSLNDAFHGEDSVSIGLHFSYQNDINSGFKKLIQLEKVRRIFRWHEMKEHAKNTLDVLIAAKSIGVVRSISTVNLEHSDKFTADNPDNKNKTFLATREMLEIHLDDNLFFSLAGYRDEDFNFDHRAVFAVQRPFVNENHPLFENSSIKEDLCTISKIFDNAQEEARGHASYCFGQILSGRSDDEFAEVLDVFSYYFPAEIEDHKIRIWSAIMTTILLFLQGEIERVGDFSQNFDHLGPLRSIPDLVFKEKYRKERPLILFDDRPIRRSEQAIDDGYFGRDTWQSLAASKGYRPKAEEDESLIDNVNDWLAHWFNTPYAIDIINAYSFLVDTPEKLQALAEGRVSEDHLSSVESSVKIRNLMNGSVTSASDVGVGISQLVPVIVNAITSSAFSVEQPELHIHPRMQTMVADLFVFGGLYKALEKETQVDKDQVTTIKTKNLDGSEKERYCLKKEDQEKSFILAETHSEHLMLRLLKRVRQNILHPDDLAVYYFQSESGVSKPVRIGIDEEGDFTNQWPEGFFEERLEELF